MAYIPNTDADRRKMLEKIGAKNFEELVSEIPDKLRVDRRLDIPALSEYELLSELEELAGTNQPIRACFAGGGVYDHFIPAAINTIISRPEFMTAYTPYQAEVSQGTLQVIYEFQSHICRLTGMEVANASMYDGATAAAEAVVISTGITKRSKVVVAGTLNPLYRDVIKTYISAREIDLVTVPMLAGKADLNKLQDTVDENTACVVVGQPNFFGQLEDIESIAETTHKVGGKLIMAVDPIAQAILKTPGEYGADFCVGEGQPLGIPLAFGRPLLGFFATRKELVRSLPGRLAARTKDIDGKPGFVLTLQTREQHIRRQKATSNICTNQALCATAASVYMSLMGKTGLKQVALLSAEKAQETAKEIAALDGFELYFDGPFVREFAVMTPRPARDIVLALVERGILPGVNAGRWYEGMEDCLIVACTEKRSSKDIGDLVNGLKELATSNVLSS
ncbi:aminomethyl-transferring glycine dehydrogenase subunit GcvPA, partial [candidate division GN15 bacterium]|nr:aminomethyl-transferring glycine dehydrogenase subunit GcvPA [candidate division GN15 bacterium]